MCLMRLVSKIMGKKTDPRDFLLNTDYEMDKIIFFTSGEVLPSTQGIPTVIPHKLGFTPLVFAVCAFQSDFSDTRMTPFLQWTQAGSIDFQVVQSNTSVSIYYSNDDDANKKLYYRIYAFEPSDSHTKIGTTSKNAKQFIINTDYNYCKLWKKGIAPGNDTTIITHDFGYIPLVMAWSGGTQHYRNTATNYIKATTNKVEIKSNSASPVHYRIYYDEV